MSVVTFIPNFMKILVISQSFLPTPCAGAEILVHQEMMYFFNRDDCDVSLFASRTSKPIKKSFPYTIHNYWPATYKLFEISYPLGVAYLKTQIANLQKKHRFDIWHVHFAYPFAPALAELARKINVPCVLTCHGSDILYVENISYGYVRNSKEWQRIKKSISKFDVSVAISKAMKSVLCDSGANASKISIIPNGVELESFRQPNEFSKKEFRLKYSIPPNASILIAVARNTPVKGLNVLLDALVLMVQKVEYVIFFIGKDTLELQQQAMKKGVEQSCRFIGTISNDFEKSHITFPPRSLVEFYKQADIYVLPSLSESFGMVVLEAMAARTAVVASSVGGVPDFVQNGKNGILVPSGQPDKLAHAITTLCRSANLREKFTAVAKEMVKGYSWESVFNQYHKLFLEIIDWR